MKISCFTPSNNTQWLTDCYKSLLAQGDHDWEWVVVRNGYATCRPNPLPITDDRIRIYDYTSPSGNVGALKRYACERCTGDLFLELDHDDVLTDDCFEAVLEAAARLPEKCFIYSDDVTLEPDGSSRKFNPDFGWQHYDWTGHGKTYQPVRQFPATPRSLCQILYAPDHVRVWSRAAYEAAGGHNPEFTVGDDHDLMIRTYLAGVHFEHIPRPLYFHRMRHDTTCTTQIDKITGISEQLRLKHTHALIKEWCRREKLPMYDLGGAHDCPEGFIPIDKNLLEGIKGLRLLVPDDLELPFGLSIPHNSVGCFRAYDFLEHIEPDKIVRTMNVLYDLLAPGGWLLSMTPAVCDNEGKCGRGAWQDPTHRSFFSSNNTWYYSDKKYARYVPEIRCRFQTVHLENFYPSEFHKTHLVPYTAWDAVALKEANSHWPGPVRI